MTILEMYTDYQSEKINGGGKCRASYSFKVFETILQSKRTIIEGNVKTRIAQINSIIIGK